MTVKEQNKFRATKQWKEFRLEMKKLQKVDQVTGQPLRKGWQLHHLDSQHYDDLDPKKFICLNPMSHELIHFMARQRNLELVLKNLKKFVKKMKEFAAQL